MRLSDASDEQDVIVARYKEDDFVGRVGRIRCDGEGGINFREVLAVVDDSDQSSADRVNCVVAGKGVALQSGAVDDHVRSISGSQGVLNLDKVSLDSLSDKVRTLLLNKLGEPLHGLVRVDDRGHQLIGVLGTIRRVYASIVDDVGSSVETPDAACHNLSHLGVLLGVLLNVVEEEEVGWHHAYARLYAEGWNGSNAVPDVVGCHAPFLRVG